MLLKVVQEQVVEKVIEEVQTIVFNNKESAVTQVIIVKRMSLSRCKKASLKHSVILIKTMHLTITVSRRQPSMSRIFARKMFQN